LATGTISPIRRHVDLGPAGEAAGADCARFKAAVLDEVGDGKSRHGVCPGEHGARQQNHFDIHVRSFVIAHCFEGCAGHPCP
jgi:hypothetical protein